MVFQKILVISRQDGFLQLARRIAREVTFADDAKEAVDIISTACPDAILLDALVQSDEIKAFLHKTDNNLHIPVIIIGNGSEESPWPSQFTHYYIPGVNDDSRLKHVINNIQSLNCANKDAGENKYFADHITADVAMAGKSRAFLETLRMLKLVAASKCNPVLIVGETGTGKELAARAVHKIRHPDEQFVAVNCAALTANLLESELFGHVKGSFTGADKDKTGLLELADSGTIFLDEISEMPLDLQAKLLRVLQEKTFRKVGGINDLVCKATIIASSNRDLVREVQANRFRRDLYYRLNICPIIISPLRAQNRKADIRLLAEYFVRTSAVCPEKTGKITTFTEIALEMLEKHIWPGNIRELRNVIDRAILLETTDKIGLSSILIDNGIDDCWMQIADCEPKEQTISRQTKPPNSVDFSLEKAERELIARALQESGWQKTKAAALLGITRATLYAKVKQHNIQKGIYMPKVENDNDASSFTPQLLSAAG